MKRLLWRCPVSCNCFYDVIFSSAIRGSSRWGRDFLHQRCLLFSANQRLKRLNLCRCPLMRDLLVMRQAFKLEKVTPNSWLPRIHGYPDFMTFLSPYLAPSQKVNFIFCTTYGENHLLRQRYSIPFRPMSCFSILCDHNHHPQWDPNIRTLSRWLPAASVGETLPQTNSLMSIWQSI